MCGTKSLANTLKYAVPSTGIYTPPDKIWKSMLDTIADSAVKR